MWVFSTCLGQALADNCSEMLEPGEEPSWVAELPLHPGGMGTTSQC